MSETCPRCGVEILWDSHPAFNPKTTQSFGICGPRCRTWHLKPTTVKATHYYILNDELFQWAGQGTLAAMFTQEERA